MNKPNLYRSQNRPKVLALLVAASAVLAVAGCSRPAQVRTEPFDAWNTPRSDQAFVQAQAAAGAVADGMLYAHHFDGDELNSLGRAKLDLILDQNEVASPAVYVVSDEAAGAGRREAVLAYAREGGVEELKVEIGRNTGTYHPAVTGLAGLERQRAVGAESGQGMPFPMVPQTGAK